MVALPRIVCTRCIGFIEGTFVTSLLQLSKPRTAKSLTAADSQKLDKIAAAVKATDSQKLDRLPMFFGCVKTVSVEVPSGCPDGTSTGLLPCSARRTFSRARGQATHLSKQFTDQTKLTTQHGTQRPRCDINGGSETEATRTRGFRDIGEQQAWMHRRLMGAEVPPQAEPSGISPQGWPGTT